MSMKQMMNRGLRRVLVTALMLSAMLCLPSAVQAATKTLSVVAGTGTPGYAGDGGNAQQAQMNNPVGVAKDAAGNIYIADTYNYRIRKIDAATGVISTIAGNGVYGFSGDGGPARVAMIGYSFGIAVAANGDVYFSDQNYHRIRKIDAATGIISTVAGTGVATYSGDGGPAVNASLYYPAGIDIAANGDLYIADRYNHRIRKIDAATGIITTVAGKGLNAIHYYQAPTCQTIYYSCGWSTCSYQSCSGGYDYWTYNPYPLGDGGSATNAGLYYPIDVAVDGNGSLIISDYNNARVRRVDAASGIISSIDTLYAIAVAVDDAGNAYYSPWGSPDLYRWDMASNLKSVELSDPALTYAWGMDAESNGLLVAGYNTQKIYKVSSNQAPLANAGVDQTAECTGNSSATVTLDGSVSSDPDGDPLNYTWSWTDATGVAGKAKGAMPAASFPIGSTTVTLTVDDGNGGKATDTVVITVQDTTAPVVNAGADVTVEATSKNGAVYDVAAQATAKDSCCTVTTSIAPVGTYPLGATTVKVSATDCAGNIGSDAMVVTVVDTTAPVLAVPADVTAEATGVQTAVAIGTATATDIFAVTVTSDAPATFPLGTTVVTWTAVDANGNTSIGKQKVTVVDTTPPAITAPADIILEASANPNTPYMLTINAAATDLVGVVSITSNAPVSYPLGITQVTWTATDAAGNSATAVQNIIVQDTTPPVLKVPVDVTVEANGDKSTANIGVATASDIFGAKVTSNDPGAYPLGTTIIIYTAVDGNGLKTTGTQRVTVVDTTAPVITAPAEITVEASDVLTPVSLTLNWRTGALAKVMKKLPVTRGGVADIFADDLFPGTFTSDAPAAFPLGTTVVTFTATDRSGNVATATMRVIVADTTPPVLTVPADVSVEATAVMSTVAIGTATATDIFAVTVTSDAPATFPVGTTVVTWTATDSSGNASSGTQNVTVADTTAPVLTVPADVTAEANAVMSSVNIGNATATDIFAVAVTSDAPATFPLGATVVTWAATDANGNVSTGTQNVIVVDTTAPALTVPADVTAEATGAQTAVAIGAATATDIFSVTVISDAPATYPLGTTVVTWTATDANGNVSTGMQNVTVADTTPPALTVPADVTAEATGAQTAVAIGAATATDIFSVTVISDAPATYPLGTTVVTWTATDANGNVTTGTQNVTVADTTPPVLTAPADVTAEANAVMSTVNIGNATATDIFAVTVTSDAPATFPLGTTVVTWTATDANGNVTTGTQNVTVVDTTAPVLTVPADVTAEANAVMSTVAIGTATATDIFAVTVTSDAPATFPLGTTVVTWTVTDANGNVSTGTQNVTVVDTTAPVVKAELVPVELKNHEGEFRVVFSATDLVDPNPLLVATLNGVTVSNGQIVELKDSKKVKIENKGGELEIKAPSFSLNVSATDASGNVGTGAASYVFPQQADDDHGDHQGNDKSEGKQKGDNKDKKGSKR